MAEHLAADEDAPDLSFSMRQEIRMSKALAMMTSETLHATRLQSWEVAVVPRRHESAVAVSLMIDGNSTFCDVT